jgi:hypothetical protein
VRLCIERQRDRRPVVGRWAWQSRLSQAAAVADSAAMLPLPAWSSADQAPQTSHDRGLCARQPALGIASICSTHAGETPTVSLRESPAARRSKKITVVRWGLAADRFARDGCKLANKNGNYGD